MSDFQRVAPRQVVAVRPLSRGMFRNLSSQQIEDGGFWTVRDAIVMPQGVYRRPAFFEIASGDTFLDHAVDAKSWIQSSGTVVEVFMTEGVVYNLSKTGGLILLPFSYTTGTVATADGDTITGTATGWTDASDWDEVQVGDYFVLDSDGTPVKISAVNSATEIELESTYPVTSFDTSVSDSYKIYRTFRIEDTQYLVDAVIANNRMVMLSKFLPPVEVNLAGDAFGYLQASGGDTTVNGKHFTAVCGAFFNERLYMGHIEEWTGSEFSEYRQRLRFSTPTDFGDFADTAYIDLDYTRGAVKAIRPLGNLLAVYLEDAIYLAQPTPDTNNPLVFDQVETGGIGLVGTKAVVAYLDGHFFVGQDNIYYHSTRGVEAIGTPVLTETVRKCEKKWRVYAVADPKRNRICFGFPASSPFIETVWSFNYLTGAGSYEPYQTYMIANPLFDNSLSWDDLGGSLTWDNLAETYPTWDDMQAEGAIERDLIREYSGKLQTATAAAEDSVAGAIAFELVSKDHDLDRPDLEKCWTRLAVKLQFAEGIAFGSAVDFQCHVSHNRGRTWKNVGVLRVRAGMDEGHCDFRLTSSTFRFRLVSQAVVVPYYITEYTFSVTPFGDESHLGSQEA